MTIWRFVSSEGWGQHPKKDAWRTSGKIREYKAAFFTWIRPLFVRDIDPNEDFICGSCGEPVLRRDLTCSKACSEELGI